MMYAYKRGPGNNRSIGLLLPSRERYCGVLDCNLLPCIDCPPLGGGKVRGARCEVVKCEVPVRGRL